MKITYLICSFLQAVAVAVADVVATHTNFTVPLSTSEASASFSRGLSTSCHESSSRGNVSTSPAWESTFTWVTSTAKTSLSTHDNTFTASASASTSSEITSGGPSIGTSTGYVSLRLNVSTTHYLSSHHGTNHSTRPSVLTSLTDMESFPTFGPSPATVKTVSAKLSFSRSAISTIEMFTPSSNSIVRVTVITTLMSIESSGYTATPWSKPTTYPLGTSKLTATQLYPYASSFVSGKPSPSSFTSSTSWGNESSFIPSTYLPPPPPPNHRTTSSTGLLTSETVSTSGY